jgi:hypothetical protein
MRNTLRCKALGLIAAAACLASAAQAMPLAPVDEAAAPQVTLVYGGCGPYGHRGPYGGCRPGGQLSGFGRRCPWGYHLGPYGRLCWPN